MVEHRLAKARVASSNLVSRSNRPPEFGLATAVWERISIVIKAALPRRGTQVVRERSAKPLCAGSIPARASNFSSSDSKIPPYAFQPLLISQGHDRICCALAALLQYRLLSERALMTVAIALQPFIGL